jgi:hypothetical protein
MHEEPKKMAGMPMILAVVALVVGLAVGFGITKAADTSSKNKVQKQLTAAQVPTTSTKAADLRATLVELGVEHMTLTDQAVDAALDGSPDASATAAALYANGNAIGAAVGSIYGTSAQNTFDAVWKIHLDDFVKYAVADKTGDKAGMAAALSDINTNYTMPLAAYLSKANPFLPDATLVSVLTDHVNMTATMIDDHVQGNYTAEAAELSMGNDHIATIFSVLAGGIVEQYPSKF